jgi:hypothetical protein
VVNKGGGMTADVGMEVLVSAAGVVNIGIGRTLSPYGISTNGADDGFAIGTSLYPLTSKTQSQNHTHGLGLHKNA